MEDDVVPLYERVDDAQTFSKLTNYLFLSALIGLNLLNYIDRYTIAGTLVDIQKYYDITDSQSGLIITVFVICYMIAAPIFGFYGDRYNRKFLICTGLIIWIFAVFLSSLSTNFILFLACRALVGVGEAAFSTIAPTFISDLFVGEARSRCLMLFYAALPVGSGLGYIIGAAVSYWTESWRWSLRVTPILGLIFVIIINFGFKEPIRGQSERAQLSVTSYKEDITSFLYVRSFKYTTLGYTCATFAIGSMSWWTPTIAEYAWSFINDLSTIPPTIKASIAETFGILSCLAGIIGVVAGSTIAKIFKNGLSGLPKPFDSIVVQSKGVRADPLVCAFSALLAVPMLWIALFVINKNLVVAWFLIFLTTILIVSNFAITTDIILYVTLPTRRGTAIAIQTLFAHLFGDAFSPYVVGLISDLIRKNNSLPSQKFLALRDAFYLSNGMLLLSAFFYISASNYVQKDFDNNQIILQLDRPSIFDETDNDFIVENEQSESNET